MQNTPAFVDLLDAADRLSLDEQETLVEILQRRMIEHRREELAKEIQEAEREYQAGRCRPVTPEELMGEVLS
jgi:preprotein translocase subunit SecA